MPLVRVLTSQPLPADPGSLLQRLTSVTAEQLGKPPAYVMVRLEPTAPMYFAGSPEPCACVEVQGLGVPSPQQARGFIAGLTEAVASLGVPADRVFVTYTSVPAELWGMRGRPLG